MAALKNKNIAPVKAVTAIASVTGAATSLNTAAPAGLILLATGGTEGTRFTSIEAMPRNTTATTRILLFRSKDGGTTKYLYRSKAFASYTYSVSADPVIADFGFTEDKPCFLADPQDQLYIGLTAAVTDGINVTAQGGEYGVE